MGKLKTSFETEVCSRCHGTGRYSYCQDYGDKCFKCAGVGEVLSKRGAAASRFFTDLCMVPISTLKVGDRIRMEGLTANMRRYSYISTVVEIKRSESLVHWGSGSESGSYYPLTIIHKNEKFGEGGYSAQDNSLVRVYRSDDKVKLEKALEYQATLTKNGTVKKSFLVREKF